MQSIESDYQTLQHPSNMAGSSSKASPRFKKAVRKLTGIAGLTLAEAMKISDYTSEEVNDYALRQRIRRAASGGPVNKKPSQITTDASTPSSMSTMTTTPPLTKHKTKKVRHTSAAVQQLRKNKCVAWRTLPCHRRRPFNE